MVEFSPANDDLAESPVKGESDYWNEERTGAIFGDLIGLTAAGTELGVGIAAGPAGAALVFDGALGLTAEFANLAGHLAQESDDIHDVVNDPSIFSGSGLYSFLATGVATGDIEFATDVSIAVDAIGSLTAPSDIAKAGGGIAAITAVAINSELTIGDVGDSFSDIESEGIDWMDESGDFSNVSASGENNFDGSFEWDGIDTDNYAPPDDGSFDVDGPGYGGTAYA